MQTKQKKRFFFSFSELRVRGAQIMGWLGEVTVTLYDKEFWALGIIHMRSQGR